MNNFKKDLRKAHKLIYDDGDFAFAGTSEAVAQLMIAKALYKLVETLEKMDKDISDR